MSCCPAEILVWLEEGVYLLQSSASGTLPMLDATGTQLTVC